MPLCPVCKGAHLGNECPKAGASISHLFQQPTDVNPDKEAEPLRPKQINKNTGREDNFIPSYYEEAQSVATMGRDAVEYLRAQYEIEVSIIILYRI